MDQLNGPVTRHPGREGRDFAAQAGACLCCCRAPVPAGGQGSGATCAGATGSLPSENYFSTFNSTTIIVLLVEICKHKEYEFIEKS